MNRKSALLGASILTGTMLLAYLLLTTSMDARASTLVAPKPDSAPVVEVPSETTTAATDEFTAALAAREKLLQDQLDDRTATIESLDTSYSAQITALEDRVAATNAELEAAALRMDDLKTRAAEIQEEIAASDLAFQEEVAGIQGNLTYQDAQVRQQIEVIYAQLQQAYDQIAANEAASIQANSGGGRNNNGPEPTNNQNNHDDDHDDDHGDDHDDDHGDDHGDDHDGDHDDD